MKVLNKISLVKSNSSGGGGGGTVTTSGVKLNCVPLGADVDSSGIASNFRLFSDSNNIGGIRLPIDNNTASGTFSYYLGTKFDKNLKFQIRFKTPSTMPSSSVYLQGTSILGSYSNTGGCGIGLALNSTLTKFSVIENQFWKSYDYTFALDTWYIATVENVYESVWRVRTSISNDDGKTFTEIGYNDGRIDLSDSSKFQTRHPNYQVGVVAIKDSTEMYCYTGKIDLTKTGYINTSTGYEYWYAEK